MSRPGLPTPCVEPMLDLRTATFRASPGYELVVSDRLSSDERAQLAALDPDPELYGLLRPSDGAALDPLAVSRDTALLFLTLQTPGGCPPLPSGTQESLDGDRESRARRGARGRARRGVRLGRRRARAAARARDDLHPCPDGGPVARRTALRPGAPPASAGDAGAAPVPLRPSPADAVAAQDAPDGGHGCGGARPRLRRARARRARPRLGGGPSRRGSRRLAHAATALDGAGGSSVMAAAKLYVSPRAENVGEVVGVVADVLGDHAGAIGFKVARDVGGLCRPDKLVCYFSRLEDLHEAVSALATATRGNPRPWCALHGADRRRRSSVVGARPTGRAGAARAPVG